MPQLEHIEAIERRLWSAADTLRANSNYASNEYFLPVMGLVFLRHAYSRYLAVKPGIEAGLPSRVGRTRPLTKEDFSQKNAIFLRPEAQFDRLVALPDGVDRASAIIGAMESIEKDCESLKDKLPKSEYRELSNDVLGHLLRKLNPEELNRVSGDVFGRICEYFLTQFADQKAHDGGEFFTPVSIVSLIAHVLEPDRGTLLDPACGSGGMFVQSARTVEQHGRHPGRRLTFRGLEKNATTIRLAKMNLAVHGLEGDIRQAITYYEDPHDLVAGADYVMANPPFNDLMIAIRSNFFYTRTVPCELWFLNRNKPEAYRDKVLMLDARSVYRQVTRRIYDFSPEQQKDLFAIVWLYRGETERFVDLVSDYLWSVVEEANACLRSETPERNTVRPIQDYLDALSELGETLRPFLGKLSSDGPHTEPLNRFEDARATLVEQLAGFEREVDRADQQWADSADGSMGVSRLTGSFADLAESSRARATAANATYKMGSRLVATCNQECDAATSDHWNARDVNRARKAADAARGRLVSQLKRVHYQWRQAHWLTSRFPDAQLCDVAGLVRLVDRSEIADDDWSLTPGRYVGVAPEEEEEDFDFEEAVREVHLELEELNAESVALAAAISMNFEELQL